MTNPSLNDREAFVSLRRGARQMTGPPWCGYIGKNNVACERKPHQENPSGHVAYSIGRLPT